MNLQTVTMLTLALAATLGSLRVLRQARRAATPRRRWRTLALIALQLGAAITLYFTLLPPSRPRTAPTLTVYTADATATTATPAIALPEAPAGIAATRLPDLASALRQHPGTRRIAVIGQGLPARDRDAARGLEIAFAPSPLPRGVVELDAPQWVSAGQSWALRGRVEAVAGGSVALHDPADRLIARTALDADGRFTLHASSRSAGLAEFSLRVHDAAQQPIERLPLPLAALAGDRLRVAMVAGGANPELKYLRRWAIDAGLQVDSRLSVSPGVALVARSVSIDAATLQTWDVLMLDDRAWYAMSAGERRAVITAVQRGLGLLLRFTGEPDARERALLAPLGFVLKTVEANRGVRLPALDPGQPNAMGGNASTARLPELSRRSLQVEARDAQPLLRDGDGEPLAQWRALGRGRIGLWWLADSYRLVLAGASDRYADIWSGALSQLARPRGHAAPRFQPMPGWVGERIAICAAGDAQVVAADGETLALIADPARGDGCAGYWPQHAGWHRLINGDKQWPFFVHAPDQAMALHAAQRRQATQSLLMLADTPDRASSAMQPIARWKLFLAWLLIACALWALERSRGGIAGY